jgi:hypothetical protein
LQLASSVPSVQALQLPPWQMLAVPSETAQALSSTQPPPAMSGLDDGDGDGMVIDRSTPMSVEEVLESSHPTTPVSETANKAQT